MNIATPTTWIISDGLGGTLATVDLTNGNLLFWQGTDANNNSQPFQILADAVNFDAARSPLPVTVSNWPWTFPNNGMPPGYGGFQEPSWPTEAPPAAIQPPLAVGTVPPSIGEGWNLLFPRRPY